MSRKDPTPASKIMRRELRSRGEENTHKSTTEVRYAVYQVTYFFFGFFGLVGFTRRSSGRGGGSLSEGMVLCGLRFHFALRIGLKLIMLSRGFA